MSRSAVSACGIRVRRILQDDQKILVCTVGWPRWPSLLFTFDRFRVSLSRPGASTPTVQSIEGCMNELLQQLHFESGTLTVMAAGEFSLDSAKGAFTEMLVAVAQYRAERILFDGRNVKGSPYDMERFLYGEFAAEETARLCKKYELRPRFAYVIIAPLRDPNGYGETVALNRGMKVKTFETPEAALGWLNSIPADR